MTPSLNHALCLLSLFAGLTGCAEPPAAPQAPAHDEGAAKKVTNRIDVPSAVRRNLGITFAKATRRSIRNTIRVPGSFEIIRDAHIAYPSSMSGHLEVMVKEHDNVPMGAPLFRVRSPAWRAMQEQLTGVVVAIRQAKARIDALDHRLEASAGHMESLKAQEAVWQARLEQVEALRAAGGGVASAQTEARAKLAGLRTEKAEAASATAAIQAQRTTLQAELAGYHETAPALYVEALGVPASKGACGRDLHLARAAALLGVSVPHLQEPVVVGERSLARWRTVEYLEVRALKDGHVEHLHVTNGAWVEVGTLVLETVDPTALRFRATALQADLGRLKNGLSAAILPPDSSFGQPARGTVRLTLDADPLARKIDLRISLDDGPQPDWIRNGVSSQAEIETTGDDAPRLAIPLHCVISDGLDKVLFRRDPKDPNKVIRLSADLGLDDGRWVVIESGLADGDEVVLDGIYELMLASGANAKLEGGHFHADGTWHADDH